MSGKIIPFGYAQSGMSELEKLMKDEKAYVVDIRLSPWSKWQEWNQTKLVERFRERYIHMPELGNLNYRQGKPIKIANAERHLASSFVSGATQPRETE